MASIHKVRWKTGEAYRVKFSMGGKTRARQFPTRREANDFMCSLGTWVPEQERKMINPPVSEVSAQWLAACSRGRAGHPPLETQTVRTYEAYVRNYVNPFFAGKGIRDIARRDAIAFREYLLESNIARITAKKVMVALRSILRHALDMEQIEADPSQGITVRLGARYISKVEIPTKAEMRLALATARELECSPDMRTAESWRKYRPMLEVLTYAGLRLSELRGLRRSDVDTVNHTISVNQRADRVGAIGSPKSAKGHRRVHIPESLSQLLAAHLRTHNFDLVFPSRTGHPLAPENIRKRMWVELAERAGIRQYSVHALRHFCASRLIEGGASPKELSETMGHSDEGFTLRVYGHLFRDDESEQRRKDRVAALVL